MTAARKNDTAGLAGSRVLLVEDEYYIADDVVRILREAGTTVEGPCSTLAAANRAIGEGGSNFAILDLNLHGESAVSIADRLLEEGKSFLIATGYGSGSVPDRLQDVPRIEKPFEPSALLDALAQLTCAQTA